MYAKALIASDPSEVCDKMVFCTAGLKAMGTEEVVFIPCVPTGNPDTWATSLKTRSLPSLSPDEQVRLLEQAGFSVTVEMVLGVPQTEVVHIAEHHHCDLIVVGSHGQSRVSEVIVGSLANGVVENSPLPVLVLRMKTTGEPGRVACQADAARYLAHILFPTDFSQNAEHAFQHVRNLAALEAQTITLLHVQDSGRPGSRDSEANLEHAGAVAAERLRHLEDILRAQGSTDVRTVVAQGSPEQAIIERTRSDDITLVVIGRHGHTHIGQFYLGGVSGAVVRNSAAPVLLVPMPN